MKKVYLVVYNEPGNPSLPYTVIEAFSSRKKAWNFLTAQNKGLRGLWIQTWKTV